VSAIIGLSSNRGLRLAVQAALSIETVDVAFQR
jgi:hypothetical protein